MREQNNAPRLIEGRLSLTDIRTLFRSRTKRRNNAPRLKEGRLSLTDIRTLFRQ